MLKIVSMLSFNRLIVTTTISKHCSLHRLLHSTPPSLPGARGISWISSARTNIGANHTSVPLSKSLAIAFHYYDSLRDCRIGMPPRNSMLGSFRRCCYLQRLTRRLRAAPCSQRFSAPPPPLLLSAGSSIPLPEYSMQFNVSLRFARSLISTIFR
jgi:hypothetical protein